MINITKPCSSHGLLSSHCIGCWVCSSMVQAAPLSCSYGPSSHFVTMSQTAACNSHLDKLADCVPEMSIPLSPLASIVWECPNLVQAITVPCLSNELAIAQNRVLADHLNDRGICERGACGDPCTLFHDPCRQDCQAGISCSA